ncbi:SdpI family protein [Pontibacter sp. Tf4]|uniref:SdpI family protein n=1 Tax=Pontibacter sp. Tf4 TaxID=2761620 RepID=UPI00162AD12C|nr:SdpI family protein [Pontibacter sp. Tf4]MBB6612868.1 SdpI family protein [Pontibacter sp. Tf4]
MKKRSNFLEILIWSLMLVPLAFLFLNWAELPDRVPIHFNHKSEADDWGSKNFLAGLVLFMTLGMNLLLLAIPTIDPKDKIANMGSKYHQLRLMLALFMAALAVFIVYSAKAGSLENSNFVNVLVGALLISFGNYFQAIKPNYFLGIRTPWTLESETVWRKTHRLGGRLWMVGGAVMCLTALIHDPVIRLTLFLGTAAVVTLVPVVHSFILSRRERQAA